MAGNRKTPGGLNDEGRFQLLVQGITDYAICMLSVDGTIISWNAGAQQMVGYTEDEIIGQHFSRFFTDEDKVLGLPNTALLTAKRFGRFESEGWRVRKDRSQVWVSSVLDAIHDKYGMLIGFAKIARDITKLRTAQQALLDSESRFGMLVKGVVDYAIYILDLSGNITNWNAGAERIKGYTAREIVGRHFSCLFTPEDREMELPVKSLEIALHEGKYEAEGWRIRKDGSRFFASVVIDAIHRDNGDFLGYAKITRDITEQRKAQNQLQESEKQFRLLVSGVTDYALYMLDLNGIISSWNKGAERIKGYSADEIIGQHFSRFYSETDREVGKPRHALSVAAQSGRYEDEGWRLRKDGTFFWASVVIDAVRDEQGKMIGFAKITRDITERREAQMDFQKMQSQLAESQKMDALGQLTGGVAHDFNNLLMIVSGYIPTLKRLVAENIDGMRAAEAIEKAAQRGATLIQQLLTFSRRQRLNPSIIGIAERINEFRDMLASALGASVHFEIDIPKDTWPIKVDATEFEIALVNLVVNARDAMPEGGTLNICAGNFISHLTDDKLAAGEYVALTIRDTGVGIPEDIVGRIFDPFFTTKPVGKGTGLGLSQVYGFAHQSGGAVEVKSVLGKGTQITIYLPRTIEDMAIPAEYEAKSSGIAGGSVLLVEDNPDVASATKELLEQLGYSVHGVCNADAALLSLDNDILVDLVVSDIVMAGRMDGLALARTLKDKYPRLPVLLVTGYSNATQDVQKEFPILHKPYDLGELSRALVKLVAKKQGNSERAKVMIFREVNRERLPKT